MVCESFINFLDFECLFVNTLAGSWLVFVGIAAFVYMLVASYFRMPMGAVGAGFWLLGIILYAWQPWVLYICSIFGAILIGISIARAFAR